MLKGKTIIVGVSGGIAAYKTCEIVARLKELNADVWVVMTKEATELVGPLTFRTLSSNPVTVNLFSQDNLNTPVPHISLADKADLILIAPCTANVIGKIAQGIADDALTTIAMASTAKKLIAPAMNCNMWRNAIVQANVQKLGELSHEFIGPEEGRLACGTDDIGRMSEPTEIVSRIVEILVPKQDLQGHKILITAGGTREAIDPVRYISNRSSGKMGYALAEAAQKRGAEVTLISGPTSLTAPEDITLIKVENAREMHTEVMNNRSGQQTIIMAAAVADYRPSVFFWQKIKKEEDKLNLDLTKTIDILADLGRLKNGSFLVGFAAETENHIENAREKMEKKNLDMIVVNDIAAFEAESSAVNIIDAFGRVEALPELTKLEVAHRILDKIISYRW